jgi:hypothetical protein
MAQRSKTRGESGTEILYNSRTDATLTEARKIYRDAFCREYIKDFNGKNALIRIGCLYKGHALSTFASNLIREPYVANRIDFLVRSLKPEDVVTRQEVMAKMWALANDPMSASIAKVAACAHVGKMLGMFKTEDKESGAGEAIGVMMVPMLATDDWQSSARTAQALLKSAARGETPVATYPPPPPPPPQPALNGNN